MSFDRETVLKLCDIMNAYQPDVLFVPTQVGGYGEDAKEPTGYSIYTTHRFVDIDLDGNVAKSSHHPRVIIDGKITDGELKQSDAGPDAR